LASPERVEIMARRRIEKLRIRARRGLAPVRAGIFDLRHSGPRTLLEIHREVRAIRREHPGLAAETGVPDGRRVLLVSLSNDPEQIRLEAILAKALQLRGGRVSPLVYRAGAPWAKHLFRGVGVRDLVYFEDYAPPPGALDPGIAERLDRCRTLADYKSF